jgi:hypothetical protein
MNRKEFRTTAIVAAISAAFPAATFAAPAGRVDFTVGNVTVKGSNGQSRTLAKGAQIEQGDTISTNNGRAQLRFTDGAYVSLQPESEFRIDQYRFDGKQDGNEKGFFSLVKGGLRTITGLVGRTNKGAYQVTTSVATIGIRGTEYTIQYGQSIVGTVGEGEINVCNGAGCLNVTNGESYYVQAQEIKPVLTNKRTDLPPASPDQPPPTFVQAESTNAEGESCAIVTCAPASNRLTGTVDPANVALVTAYSGGESFTYGWQDVQQGTTATLSGQGLTDYVQGYPGPESPVVLQNPVEVGNDGIIAWGTASGVTGGEFSMSGPTFGTLHWAVGLPTPDMGPLANMTGTYDLLGATLPTSLYNGDVAGTLNSASMTVNFTASSAGGILDMAWTLRGTPVSTQMSVFGSGGTFSASTLQSGSSYAYANGFFAGANAERAGMVYQVDVNSLEESFIGAAALKQTSLTPTPIPQ